MSIIRGVVHGNLNDSMTTLDNNSNCVLGLNSVSYDNVPLNKTILSTKVSFKHCV